MSALANCRLIRRWLIVEADIRDRDHLATVRAGDHPHRRQSAHFFNGLLGFVLCVAMLFVGGTNGDNHYGPATYLFKARLSYAGN